jgi:hypothetical protein
LTGGGGFTADFLGGGGIPSGISEGDTVGGLTGMSPGGGIIGTTGGITAGAAGPQQPGAHDAHGAQQTGTHGSQHRQHFRTRQWRAAQRQNKPSRHLAEATSAVTNAATTTVAINNPKRRPIAMVLPFQREKGF